MYNFTIPREKFDENNPDKQIIRHLISKHISMVDRLKKNMAYYQGKHKILEESNRDNRLVCNHAKDMQSNIPPDKELNPEDKPEKTKETTDVDE